LKRTITTIALAASVALSVVPAFAAIGHASHKAPVKHSQTQKVISAVCPVMGTRIPDVTKAAGKSTYKGKTYYFCDGSCKVAFDKNPGNYINAKPKEITWHQSLADAITEAKQRKTLILVDAYAEWCGWCKKLEKETLADPQVQARLQDFTLLKIDTDKQPDLAQQYDVAGLPTTLVLNAKGKVILSQAGYLTPKDYLGLLAQAAEKRAE